MRWNLNLRKFEDRLEFALEKRIDRASVQRLWERGYDRADDWLFERLGMPVRNRIGRDEWIPNP